MIRCTPNDARRNAVVDVVREDGLPIGVQIIGRRLEDRTTIAFAAPIEREFGGFVPPPLT